MDLQKRKLPNLLLGNRKKQIRVELCQLIEGSKRAESVSSIETNDRLATVKRVQFAVKLSQ